MFFQFEFNISQTKLMLDNLCDFRANYLSNGDMSVECMVFDEVLGSLIIQFRHHVRLARSHSFNFTFYRHTYLVLAKVLRKSIIHKSLNKFCLCLIDNVNKVYSKKPENKKIKLDFDVKGNVIIDATR